MARGGMHGQGACMAWLGGAHGMGGMRGQGGMRGKGGACMAKGGGVHGRGVCVAKGACVAKGGMHDKRGEACVVCMPPYEIRLVNARAVCILLECILVVFFGSTNLPHNCPQQNVRH